MANLVRKRIPPLPTIRELIRVYKLGAKKRLSQNFLLNPNAIKKLVKCAGDISNGYVCEVGPGPGGITREILQSGVKELSVIEKDDRFLPILRSLIGAYNPEKVNLRLFHGDVLKFNMKEVFPESEKMAWEDNPPNIHIIGNLPFNISTALIIRWLNDIANQQGAWSFGRVKLTLTFQMEIGERMVAPILDAQRSRLSVMCQYLCNVKVKHILPGKVFLPAPKVDAAVVHFVPLIKPKLEQPFHIVEKVVRHTFHYRQKYCSYGIKTLFPPPLQYLCDDMFKHAEVDPTTRPQQLSVEDFQRLCDLYANFCAKHAGLFEYYYRDPKSDFTVSQETIDKSISDTTVQESFRNHNPT